LAQAKHCRSASPRLDPMAHCYRISAPLRTSLESQRYPGKWAGVRGLVEDNDALIKEGGFKLPDGTWQPLPSPEPAEVVRCASPSDVAAAPRCFSVTEISVANVDTLTAALVLGDASALNFANATTPGGRYRSGGLAQEEDLCRLLPQLYPSLNSCEYPIEPDTALVSRGLLAVRQAGTYERCRCMGEKITVISAAMPCGMADRRPKGGWAGSTWAETVTLRIRTVLQAAQQAGHANVVLGAFGCGAFGNPAGPVAAIFREQLAAAEFRGSFARVVFAIIDPLGTGNLKPFKRELALLDRHKARAGKRESSTGHHQTDEDGICAEDCPLENGKGGLAGPPVHEHVLTDACNGGDEGVFLSGHP